MVEHYGDNGGKLRCFLQDQDAHAGMLAYYRPFIRLECTGLVQYRVGDRNFADVVQQARPFQDFALFGVQPHPCRDLDRQYLDGLGMACRVAVLGVGAAASARMVSIPVPQLISWWAPSARDGVRRILLNRCVRLRPVRLA